MSRTKALLAGAAAAAVLLLAAGGVLAQPLAKPTPKPSAGVVFSNGVHVLGKHFKPKEHVALSITSSGTTWKRTVSATAAGTFDVDFGLIRLSSCNDYLLKVVGSLGSRAGESHPTEPC